MTKERLKEIVADTADNATKLFKRDGSIAPVLFVYHTSIDNAGKEIYSCAIVPITSIERRESILFQMGKMFLKNNKPTRVDAVVLISEAWMSVKDTRKGPVDNILPSQDPDRKEIVNITGMTDTRESAMLVFEIKDRNNAEKRTLEKNEKASNLSKIENRLLDRFWQGMGMVVGRTS